MKHGVDPTLRNHERETAISLVAGTPLRSLLVDASNLDAGCWTQHHLPNAEDNLSGQAVAGDLESRLFPNQALRASWRGDATRLSEIIVSRTIM